MATKLANPTAYAIAINASNLEKSRKSTKPGTCSKIASSSHENGPRVPLTKMTPSVAISSKKRAARRRRASKSPNQAAKATIRNDTSVFVSALTHEPPSTRVQAWLGAQPPGSLISSERVATEFSAALSVKPRTGEIDGHARTAALAKFNRLSLIASQIVAIGREHFRAAARFADQSATVLRAGDALHLAVAAAEGAAITTLDKRLALAASALNLGGYLIWGLSPPRAATKAACPSAPRARRGSADKRARPSAASPPQALAGSVR